MDLSKIAHARLISQQITASRFTTPKDIVAWMGAMQAQDYAMSKYAVALRLPGSTDETIQAAIDKGDIIRTHLLRPTWHLISADDIYWMTDLAAPQIKTKLNSRAKELELTPALIRKTNRMLEKALTGGKHLSREDLVALFEKANIVNNDNRVAHILLHAEMEGIICSGPLKNKKLTYALLEERVPKRTKLQKEEAVAKLAYKYFSGHGPATWQDFLWWSGLSVKDAKRGVELIKSDFISETIDGETYIFHQSLNVPKSSKTSLYLLPAYDEFIIGYKNRTASLSSEDHKKVVSNNGIFWPVILVNGIVAGSWRRTITKNEVLVETEFFTPQKKETGPLLRKAVSGYKIFISGEAG